MPDGGERSRNLPWRKLESVALILVALHSYAVGAMLLLATAWTMKFAGWGEVDALFFPRQSGAFHLVVATGYLLEYFRRGSITLLILAKVTAVVFLLVLNPWQTAWSIPFSGIFDGLMLVGMLFLHAKARSVSAD